MTAEQIVNYAKRTGRVWLGGEMEIPFPSTVFHAYYLMVHIAEECGYIVSKQGPSRIYVVGGGITGQIVLDWFSADNLGPAKVEVWTEDAGYFPQPKKE